MVELMQSQFTCLQGMTALYKACMGGFTHDDAATMKRDRDLFELLMSRGADVNARNNYVRAFCSACCVQS